MGLINTEDGAKRLAKTIMQDISLYNADKIRGALQNDTLFDELATEFREGESLYKSRVAPEILQRTNYYERAINDFLIKEIILRSKGELASKIA